MSPLAQKRIFITGAASGIGRQLALGFAEQNARLFLTDIDETGLKRLAHEPVFSEVEVFLARLDVSSLARWNAVFRQAVRKLGGIDVMLNVAGDLAPGFVHEFSPREVSRHFDINTKGVVYGTRLAAEHMVPAGTGHIVNIASMAGLAPVPGIALYSASKFAVRAFSLAAAMELKPRGVQVTVICPDPVQTPMLDRQAAFPEAALTFSAPRYLTVEEIERAVHRTLAKPVYEIILPGYRGLLAKFASFAPALAPPLGRLFTRIGLRNQSRYRPDTK